MSEPKFTPGPWTVRFDHDNIGYPCYFIHGFSGDAKRDVALHTANANMIAAAPDLYAALEMLLADIEEYQRINQLGGENNHAQVLARAALAKAEGRSHE